MLETSKQQQPVHPNATETTSLLNDSPVSSHVDSHTLPPKSQSAMTTVALSVALLVQSYLLVGVFPYSGFMAMHLIPGLTEENAGSYAGLIASSFMLGRTFSSLEWGKAADRYGRLPVIQTSLLLSAVISIAFGMAPTFGWALVARFCLGLSNGLIGPIKTVISELSKGDTFKETQMIAIVMGMWGYGFLLNPAISGYLSDPVKQYPHSPLMDTFRPVLAAYPFLLPNVFACVYALVGFVMVTCYVEETLPKEKRQSFMGTTDQQNLLRTVSSWGLFKHLHSPEDSCDNDTDTCSNTVPAWIRPSPSTTALTILSTRSSTTSDATSSVALEDGVATQEMPRQETIEAPATVQSLWNQQSTRQHLLVYWVFSFLVISIDEIFPLFCISNDSGLGIQESMIGNLLSGTGVFYIFIQYFLLTRLVDNFGFYPSLRIGALFSIPLVAILPFSLFLNRNAQPASLTWSSLLFLSGLYALIRSFTSVTFSTLTMTTNRTVPAHHRATMNGFSMLGGSLAKALGPTFAGLLFSFNAQHVRPPFGSVVAYAILSLLGLGLFVQTMLLVPVHELVTTEQGTFAHVESFNKPVKSETSDEEPDTPPSF